LGLPGALPVPNKRAVELCILLGLATGCDIENEIRFDRKHYFYPDLPKGYQISQYDQPICSDGFINITDPEGNLKRIDIERIHQEEDVAKSTHHTEKGSNKEYTLVDYNKSGVPLIEIVTRPVIRSASDAKEFAARIRQIARYLGVSDADMEKGQMRCEPNLSVQEKGKWEYKDGRIIAKEGYKLNPKVEIKNIGSISAIEKAIEYESSRLIEELEAGNSIKQQTRGWNPDAGVTEFQRSKETAEDYRYFPEPDIPIIEITESDIEKISGMLTELPDQKRDRYVNDMGLSEYDAGVLTADLETSKYFEDISERVSEEIGKKDGPKAVSNWISSTLFGIANEKGKGVYELGIEAGSFSQLIVKAHRREILTSKAKQILVEALESGKPLSDLLDQTETSVIADEDQIRKVAQAVIESNDRAVTEYRNGKDSVIMFLVGQVMKETQGNADPATAKSVLEKLLKN
jgi:aspartyl-tRNA(Asn)/glutamyl-tRNA(Gln) amidotransferase subunit B